LLFDLSWLETNLSGSIPDVIEGIVQLFAGLVHDLRRLAELETALQYLVTSCSNYFAPLQAFARSSEALTSSCNLINFQLGPPSPTRQLLAYRLATAEAHPRQEIHIRLAV
jgi:hypothetical protein